MSSNLEDKNGGKNGHTSQMTDCHRSCLNQTRWQRVQGCKQQHLCHNNFHIVYVNMSWHLVMNGFSVKPYTKLQLRCHTQTKTYHTHISHPAVSSDSTNSKHYSGLFISADAAWNYLLQSLSQIHTAWSLPTFQNHFKTFLFLQY